MPHPHVFHIEVFLEGDQCWAIFDWKETEGEAVELQQTLEYEDGVPARITQSPWSNLS